MTQKGGRERGKRMNTRQIMYTHVYKCKMIPVETVAGMGVGGGSEFKYHIFDTL
jgi:hypothetical protein